ncbi:hypothetical protein TNCT_670751 [Trichonephila clavata]|uniref:D-isomer specific 2-hydroxyacid dehydrogenase NAD-binding domain-containing protein n=1 Tax=Trichonephila clavata TaxID=2740835 RepID=A0A8X6M325_TRICU|nr:hypothetical protein TNCT_670751 [Trichonephila clavata]
MNILSKISVRYHMLKMAECFSSSSVYACPPIYILSQISNLAKCFEESALPGIQIRSIDISDVSPKNPVLDEEKINAVKNTEIAVCDGPLLAKIYKHMPDLKWAHCTWAGIDSLIKEIPEEPKFTITRHNGEAFCSIMAEYVVCHILNNERQTKQCWKNQESKIWLQEGKIGNYRTLDELTVSILGAGNMAFEIAKFLKSRGTTVFGFAKNPRPSTEFGWFDKITTELNDILPDCDYLCNTLPNTPLTCGILNVSVLEKCKKKPVFINVGRGNIIPENDLVQALKTGCLSGAVLDVFETEPLPESSLLWDMPQVTITPHVAAISRPEDVADEFFKQFLSYTDGHGLKNVVKWFAGY